MLARVFRGAAAAAGSALPSPPLTLFRLLLALAGATAAGAGAAAAAGLAPLFLFELERDDMTRRRDDGREKERDARAEGEANEQGHQRDWRIVRTNSTRGCHVSIRTLHSPSLTRWSSLIEGRRGTAHSIRRRATSGLRNV